MFQALIFDLDNTLLDRPAAQWRWSERFVDRWLPDSTKETKAKAAQDLFALDDLGYISREEFVVGVLDRVPDWQPEDNPASSADPASRIAALLIEYRRELISLYPRHEDICDFVERLRQKSFQLGVISNGRVSSQWPKMQRAGLDSAFESIVISEEVGFEKPHPEPFLASLRVLDVAPENALYVGDNPYHDVGGAAAVGMKNCWVALGREFPEDAPVRPDLQIDSVRDLESALSSAGLE